MLWIALHLPALSLESWAATLGAARASRPLALLQEHAVWLADKAAAERGVKPGMKRATALALAPDLLWAQADPRRDAQALRAVVHAALAYSPAVAWATPPDWRAGSTQTAAEASGQGDHATTNIATSAASNANHSLPPNPAPSPALVGVRLEVQSCLRYFGGLRRLLLRLRDDLAPLGHGVRIASAPTALGAALLAAWRDDLALGAHSTGLAALQALLDAVPLHLLGPGQQHWQALQGMGLSTLGDLAGLPRSGLARRFSPELLDDIDRARGRLPEAHRWLSLPQRFDERIELFTRADTSAQVQAGADVLLPRLLAWARARQARVVAFDLVMHHESHRRRNDSQDSDAPSHSTLSITPAQPSAEHDHLRSLLAERLARLPLAAPALELSLHCDALSAGGAPNGELFASHAGQREGLARLVERLQARLGREQVQRFGAVADHRPEHSTRWQPADAARLDAPLVGFVGVGGTNARGDASAAAALATQPLWLLPSPLALPERGQGPLLDGRPLQLLAGPERLETGWWDGQPALRDYFIAQAASGALVWVYRHRVPADPVELAGAGAASDIGSGWFLQGLFA